MDVSVTSPDVPAAPPPPQVKYCPLCFDGYLDDTDLQRHIARVHGKQHIYLTINGIVVRDVCWTTREIDQCELVLLNHPEVVVRVKTNGQDKDRFHTASTCSLRSRFPTATFQGRIDVLVDGRAIPMTREFTIYKGKQPDFRADMLDCGINAIQSSIRQAETIDLAKAFEQLRRSDMNMNDLERRYVRGFEEYCHGFQLDVQGSHERGRHCLEMAMELLLPFQTANANAARNVLALRMNCFATFKACEEDSPFSLVKHFFCDEYREPDTVCLPEMKSALDSLEVLIDPMSETFLSALVDFYRQDHGEVFRRLDLALSSGLVRDRNDEDKLSLLEARTYRHRGEHEKAVDAYTKIVPHPLFQKEAGEYCDRYK